MYLSDNEIRAAIEAGSLIVNPIPKIGSTSVDLRLDSVDEARIWDIESLRNNNRQHGHAEYELPAARIDYGRMSQLYLKAPPLETEATSITDCRVFRRHREIVVKPLGFVLWQTKEVVGTPEINPEFICFVDGKSTRARTGLVVHLTAPTIHAGWSGKITLEITNLGPFHLVLKEDDTIAQIIVAKISSPPSQTVRQQGSVTIGQTNVGGSTNPRL